MKAVCKKLFSLMLVAILLVSAVPFQASAEEVNETTAPATEEATVATEAAVVETAAADPADAEVSAEAPEAYAGVKLEDDVVRVDFQLAADDELGITKTYRVDLVKSKLGKKVSPPSGSEAMSVLKKALGSNDCIEFVRWYYINSNDEKVTYTSSIVLNEDNMLWDSRDVDGDEVYGMYLDVYAEFKRDSEKITLDPNGGTVSSKTLRVMIGQEYGYYCDGVLPTPTRDGYTFTGWYKDGELIEATTKVADLGKLTAKWRTGRYQVTFMSFASGEWEEVDAYTFTVDNKAVLKTDYSNFPNSTDIKNLFKAENYTMDGWEYSKNGGDTWKTFTAGKTTITADTIIRPLYTRTVKLYATDDGNTTRTITVTLGKKIPALPNPGSREFTDEEGKTVNRAFVGWFTPSQLEDSDYEGLTISNRYNLSDVSKHPVYEDGMGDKFIAGWQDAVTIYLYIHTNGNTKDHTKLVKYYDVPNAYFDLTSLDLAELFPNYGKYDDKGDEKYGWYSEAQWDNYCLGRHINDTTESVKNLDTGKTHEFHIMLIDNGNNTASSGSANGTGYNDNKTTVDSSNPSTGDDIFVAVTIMAVSACAVLLIFMNKKRFVK